MGTIEYYFENSTVTARAGDLLFLAGNLPYAGMKKSRNVAFFVLNFECTAHTAFQKLGAPCTVSVREYETAYSLFSEAREIWNHRPIDCELRLKSFAYSLLCSLFTQSESHRSSVTEDILTYIAENLHDSTISMAGLCHRFYISESQLRRNIHKATGLNPNEYLLLLRLTRAKNELLCTEKTIKQIAAECGFASPYYFTRRFTAQYGSSPTAWRKANTDI